MRKKEKKVLSALGGLTFTLALYATARLLANDTDSSIIPGWQTTMYPPDITWTLVAAIVLAEGLFLYLILRAVVKLCAALWTKLKT